MAGGGVSADTVGRPVLDAYRAATPPAYDELLRLLRVPDAQPLVDAIERLAVAGLKARRQDVRRLVLDDGVTYVGTGTGAPQPWLLDPVPLFLDGEQWRRLEAGLDQRARLLDALLADLHGERRMLRDGLVPAELVIGHAEYLPAAEGIRLSGPHQLPLVATDLTRAPDGSWLVLSDRTQAPSGMGYAMANRRIVSRALDHLYRGLPLRRLRPFFDQMQRALFSVAPRGVTVPQVVLLTAGPASETAYDQALLSTLLGHPLAQADDLVMHDGKLWLRSTGGRRHAVDVVLRRVDAAWCDSLDLRPESRLGVPGLVAAARRGAVGVVNPFGAGVLENAGLLPYLPGVARALVGEELQLGHPPTWWCGDDVSRSHVLSRLDELVIKPIARSAGTTSLPGWDMDRTRRDLLRARIEAEPWLWAAQEPVPSSTAPVVTPTGLEPRSVVLRTFGVGVDGGYVFLPGGLARVGAKRDAFVVTNLAGAIAKDVWVMGAEPATGPYELVRASPRSQGRATVPGLTPRGAGNLFWTGRYSERTQSTARLLKVIDNLVEDNLNRADTPGHTAMTAMLGALWEVTAARPEPVAPGDAALLDDPLPSLRALLVDSERRGCVAYNAARLTYAASDVREMLSFDTFGVLNRLAGTLAAAAEAGDEVEVQEVCAHVMEACLALAGMTHESLMRDPVWAFLEAGQRLERAQLMVRLLRHTVAVVRPPIVEAIVTEAVLRVGDSLITYRRRMAAGVGSNVPAAATVQLLLTDDTNPRSVVFSLGRTLEAVLLVPDRAVEDVLVGVLDLLRGCDEEALCRGDRSRLVALLDGLDEGLRAAADAVSAAHFDAQQPSVSFAVPELAGPGEEAS